MQPENIKTLLFEEIGADTQTTFKGKFEVKLVLSPRDLLKAGQLERGMIGDTSKGQADDLSKYYAYMIGQLAVRLKTAPAWWKESNDGLDLEDTNILEAVFTKVHELVEEYQKARAKRAEEAKASVEKTVQEELHQPKAG